MMRIVKGVVGNWRRSESGFTLIEMLIVVGIIVALAAAIVPTVVRQASKGEEGSKASEEANVQSALDTMMAENGIQSITAQANTSPIKGWLALPLKSDGTTVVALSPLFLRNTSTQWGYCWTAAGKITQTADKTSTTC
jgi:prepilin-type N-terminal cleavage/methylation domain-containing protein